MYRYSLHTVRHVVYKLRRIPSSSLCSSNESSPQQNGRQWIVPATKRQTTKCPHEDMAGDEVSQRRNGWRWSVPVTKRLRRNCSNETSCSISNHTAAERVGGDQYGVGLEPSSFAAKVARGITYFGSDIGAYIWVVGRPLLPHCSPRTKM